MRSYGETRCIDQQKPKTKIKIKDAKKYTAIRRSSEKNWSMKVVLLEPRGNPAPGDQDTSSSSHELPMESRAKVEKGSGKHSIYSHFPKDPNCDICVKTRISMASCRRRAGTVGPKAEHSGDLITADHEILSEESESRNNHRYAVVVQNLARQWLQSYPCCF